MAKKEVKEVWVELRGATEKFSQDMNRAVGKITKVERQLTGVATNIQRVFQAALVIGGVAAVNKLGDALGKLAEKGEEAGSIRDAFVGLGGSRSSIETARQSVLGLVESFDLMQISNKGLLAGVPQWNESFSMIADLGARVADTLGGDTKQSIEELSDAIIKGQAKALKPLGFTFTDTSDKAKVTREAIAQLPGVMARLAPVSDSVANANVSLKNRWSELNKELGITVNQNPTLIAAIRNLEAALSNVDLKQLASDLANLQASALNFAAIAIPKIAGALRLWQEAVDRLSAAMKAGPLSTPQQRQDQLEIIKEARAIGEATDATNRWVKAVNDLFIKFKEGSKPAALAIGELREEGERLVEVVSAAGGFKSIDLEGSIRRATEQFKILQQNQQKNIVETGNYQVKENKKVTQIVTSEYLEQSIKAHQESIASWESLFENAITGVTFNLKDALRQVAVGFAAEMANAIIGPLGEIGGPKGIGGAIARGLLGQAVHGAGGKEGLLGALGISGGVGGLIGTFGMSGEVAALENLVGPLTAAGEFTPASGILGALGPWGVGGLAALGIGGAMFGSKLFGHAPKNPDTIARRKASEWIEGITGKNFVVGSSSKFNTEAGFASLHKLDKEAQGIFMALGQSIKSTLGITEDITEQIATLLVENTGEGIDKAKAMWQSLGLNAEEVQQKIIQDMIKAGKTWLEIESILAGIDRLNTPGLDGKGDFVGAFQQIIESNATGMEATNAVISSAIEAAEANFKTFEEWKNALKQHFDPAQVDIFFQALAQRGVSDFKTLQDASIRTAGAIISDMQALGFAFEDVTKKIQEAAAAVNTMTGGVSELPSNIAGTEIPRLARGGIVTRPTLAVIGEAGPEIVMPMARFSRIPSMSGRGGGQGITVHIDARGAGPGVERNLMRVMREISEQSVARGINHLIRVSSRGGRGGL